MEIDVVQIGTLGEIRIPQSILTQCRIGDRVELQVEGALCRSHPAAGLVQEPSGSNSRESAHFQALMMRNGSGKTFSWIVGPSDWTGPY